VDHARSEFREALEVAREVSDRGLESEILTSLGDLEDSVGESQKALAEYALALPIARESNNRNAECRLIHNMAVVRDFLGESQRALDGYREVLTLCRSLGGKRAEAQVLTSIGRLYIDLGEREAGLQHLASAAALALEVGDQRSRARILFHVGRARERAGEVDSALAAYAEARDLGRQSGEPFREAAARGMIAGILGARGDPSALSEFDRALELARAGKSPWVESVVLKGRGRFLADLSLAAEIDHRTGDRLGEAESRFELARLERSSGRPAEAWTFASTALDLMEALRTEVASHDLRAAFFATSQDLYDFSVDLLMELGAARPGEGFETTAWTVHERSRARSLLDVLSARDSVSGHVDPALLERERSLRKRIARATDDPTRVAGDARESVTAAADVEKLRSEYETVRRSIQSSNPEYAALAFGDPVSIERVQSELGPDALLAEFHLGEERSFLWIVGRDSVRTFVLPPRARIERSAEALYGELRAPGSDWHAAASDLGSQLLQPVASLLSSRVLVVVPDGTLQLIPFAVLGLPGQTPPQLVVARFEVVQVPSASVLTLLRRDATARTSARTLAVLADPVLDASDPRVRSSSAAKGRPEPSAERGRSSAGEPMPRLPFTRREASAIGDLVPAANRRIALGFDANLDLARSAELGGYRYVHFATHAVTGGEHPERAALVLSRVTPDGRLRDGLLPVAEIFNLRLSADLVVLSACQTALGRSVRGEGLLGLARAFMYAGAPRVVASLWRVDDSATAELMRRFYGGMLGREHFAPGEALRRAQLSVSATKRWADPYYWAGFVLQGDWR
jgi:CHAT domain-containing protein/tetratricopeptide (TPR) repeat protein